MESMVRTDQIVIYTAIFDGYDVLMEPEGVPNGVDMICFTDDASLTSERWEIRTVRESPSPAMANRKLKILAHRYLSDFEYSVYVDGNVHIVDDVSELVSKYLVDHPLVVPPHPKRDCAYEEADSCVASGKADRETIRTTMSGYSNEGFPREFGLSENNVILRSHNDERVVALMNEWWDEVRRGPGRDQLSLPYVLWKNEAAYRMLDFVPRNDDQYFVFYPHRGEYNTALWSALVRALTSLPDPMERTAAGVLNDSVDAYRHGGVTELCTKTAGALANRLWPGRDV